MSISFSGLASGLDTSGWVDALVSVKQEKITSLQTELTALQNKKSSLTTTRSTFNTFRTAIEKLTDKKFGGTFDLFGKNAATSSNEDVFTATASSSALRQSYDIAVQQLATYTKATSIASASTIADDTTKLKNIGITDGKLTVYVDGVKNTIDIEKEDTLGDLKTNLAAKGVRAELDTDGILRMSSINPAQTLDVGSTTDTTNLMSFIGVEKQDDGTYASTSSMFKANLSTVLTSENSGFNTAITAGTFTIGAATFTIDESTTLSGILYQINNSEEAQAQAYWDDTTGKLTITSTKEGASYINIEAGSSNFTDVMGLTVTDEGGESRMYTNIQELGKNAIFSVNGTMMISTSNIVSSDVSRIEGVTLTLKGVSEDSAPSTLQVTQNSSELLEAVKNFVTAYNDTINQIDTMTAKGGELQRETSLTSFKSTIRNFAMGANTYNGGAYSLLSQIGISTSKADASNISTNSTSTLTFDEDLFLQALEEDPSSVEAILAGENSILAQMESAVETTLKASVGFFDVKQSTIDSDIVKMESKIKKQKTKVSSYRSQLEAKFKNMESLIASMQQNYSSFLS